VDHSRSCDPSLDDPLPVADAGPADPADSRPGDGHQHGTDDHVAGLDAEAVHRLAVTQPAIEQAKGMLMAYYGIDADAAFDLLSRWSSERHVKVRDLSRMVVERGSTPDPRPFGALRRVLEQGESG